MPVEVIKTLRQLFFNASLYNAYAQSESCPAISYLEPSFAIAKAGSVGRAVQSVQIAILDPQNQPLSPHLVGEICVRGENIMKGYHKQPEATQKKIIDGWLHTGDLGYLDEEGFLYLVDRTDDLIITGGENVYPKEIEEVLYTHGDILEAAVIGVPDRAKGSVVAAFIVPKDGKTILSGEIRRFCVARLAGFKVPRHVRILEVLPRNPSGKVLKPELRRRWELENTGSAESSKRGEKGG
jgi:acyl-CoA synthetase (AMP-forming)/AMP-acid ligase II